MIRTLNEAELHKVTDKLVNSYDYHRWQMDSVIKCFAYFVPRGKWFAREDIKAAWGSLQIEGKDRLEAALFNLSRTGVLITESKFYSHYIYDAYALAMRHRQELEVLEQKDRLFTTPIKTPEPEAKSVSESVKNLIQLLSNESQLEFARETYRCLEASAYRAAIVMAWNLAYDHYRSWLLNKKQAEFNAVLISKNKSKGQKHSAVASAQEMNELKESLVLLVGREAKLISKETYRILSEALDRRNRYAHPSGAKVGAPTAAGHVHDLLQIMTGDELRR